jgi:hypothetical protein
LESPRRTTNAAPWRAYGYSADECRPYFSAIEATAVVADLDAAIKTPVALLWGEARIRVPSRIAVTVYSITFS